MDREQPREQTRGSRGAASFAFTIFWLFFPSLPIPESVEKKVAISWQHSSLHGGRCGPLGAQSSLSLQGSEEGEGLAGRGVQWGRG